MAGKLDPYGRIIVRTVSHGIVGGQSDSLWLRTGCDFRTGACEMRSALITACILLNTYAPATGVHSQFQQAPSQAQAAPPQRQAQADRGGQEGTARPDIRRGNTSVAQERAVARSRAESHWPLGAPATDAQPPQPANRQLTGAMGLLLAFALMNGAGAIAPASSQPEIKPWIRVTVDVKARDSEGE